MRLPFHLVGLTVSICCCVLLASAPATAKKRKHAMKVLKHVVLDPGHGGSNQGTPGAHGVHEKYLTLPIALELERLLRKHTTAEVTLTRKKDVFLELRDRTRIANEAGGDIFLSIHLNASPRPQARGLEVYFLSPDAATAEIAEVVAREEGADDTAGSKPAGPGGPDTPLTLEQILQDATMYRAHERAELVAEGLLNGLHKVLKAPRRGVFQAPFGVLKEAQMPAVVVEVGFLSHAKEGKALTTKAYQRKVAKALYESLVALDKRLERD